jgi:hypothetical protein
MTEEEGGPLHAHDVGFVELVPFSPELLDAIATLLREFSSPEFPAIGFPIRFQAELHAIDAGGNTVCSPPTDLDILFCIECAAAC